MMRTGLDRPIGATVWEFEGLVLSTVRMFASQVRREEEDFAQELRVIVWRAITTYDRTRSSLTLERHVFQCITNKVKDYKRDAAREARRQEDNGISFGHIEAMLQKSDRGTSLTFEDYDRQELFEQTIEGDEVYRAVDGLLSLPADVTEREAQVLLLLMMQFSKSEIALRLGVTRVEVEGKVEALREKLADWKPPPCSESIAEAQIEDPLAA